MPKTDTLVGGLTAVVVDPAIEQFRKTAAHNRSARTPKQKYDAARRRVRTDCPGWLIARLDEIAAELHTSRTQLTAFFLAWAVSRYARQDPELEEILYSSMRDSRNINVETDIGLETIWKLLTNSAGGPPGPD